MSPVIYAHHASITLRSGDLIINQDIRLLCRIQTVVTVAAMFTFATGQSCLEAPSSLLVHPFLKGGGHSVIRQMGDEQDALKVCITARGGSRILEKGGGAIFPLGQTLFSIWDSDTFFRERQLRQEL